MTPSSARSGQARVSTSRLGPHRPGRRNPTSVGAWPILFVGPLMLGIAVFYYWPIVKNIVSSLQQTDAFGRHAEFVGLQNYSDLFSSPDLSSAMLNTLLYTLSVLLGIPLSVIIASMIELPGLRFKGLYRALYFMPYLAMPMAVAQVWKIVYNGQFGLLNQILRGLGVNDPPYWLVTP